MASPVGSPPVEAPPSSSMGSRKSYAAMLNKSLYLPMIQVEEKVIGMILEGEPAVYFSPQELSKSEEPFSLSLFAKCSYGRPPIHEVKEILKKMFSITMDFVISSLDRRHLLLRFTVEEDFIKDQDG
ncbi:uncharacterized protein LOC122073144 [Macadamia integrifolia]|uniref:uncharacterized protein LOC122073144 n=1 Tax=Macadamia integrifolia TaxID=60698 RepID=UPI001C4F095A|nr:uncharacterized protein LOC122073144 [Macadamia integrifolia]